MFSSIRALADHLNVTSVSPVQQQQHQHHNVLSAAATSSLPVPRSAQPMTAGTTLYFATSAATVPASNSQGAAVPIPVALDMTQLASMGILPAYAQQQQPGVITTTTGMVLQSTQMGVASSRRVSAGLVPAGEQPMAYDSTQQQYHQHHRSVVADVPYLQGTHHHELATTTSSQQQQQQQQSSAYPVPPPLLSTSSSSSTQHNRHTRSNLRDLEIETLTRKVLGRLIIIGDVHGCPDQLRELAQTLKYDKQLDLMIIAGDLVNKGPDSCGAVKAAIELGALAVVGNHDTTVLELVEQIEAREIDPFSKKHDRDPAVRVARGLTDDCVRYLRNLPHVIRVPQYNLMVLHAGMNLSYPLEEQTIRDLTHLRRLAWNSERNRYDSIAKGNHGTLWAKLYKGPELVVFGHDARSGLQEEAHALGLDTGCCYGGQLTAVVFPGKKLVSVKGLPKESRLGADEDYDETAVRLETPTTVREPSPTPSSFYDPIPMSNRSTPQSTLAPNSEPFPLAPSVQQLFMKVKQANQQNLQQQPGPSAAPVPAAATPPATLGGSSVKMAHDADPISFLRATAMPSDNATMTTPGADTAANKKEASHHPHLKVHTASDRSTPPLSSPSQGVTSLLQMTGASSSSSLSAAPQTQNDNGTATASDVKVETLLVLMKHNHFEAVVSLLRVPMYEAVWQLLMDGDVMAPSSFWNEFVMMFISAVDGVSTAESSSSSTSAATASAAVSLLVDLLVEIVNSDRVDELSNAARDALATLTVKIDSGAVKCIPKGAAKAIKLSLK